MRLQLVHLLNPGVATRKSPFRVPSFINIVLNLFEISCVETFSLACVKKGDN